MIGCLRTHVRKQPIIALYFESENELEFYNLEARHQGYQSFFHAQLRMKFILLIYVKMPTIVGILSFISSINNLSFISSINDLRVLKQDNLDLSAF